MSEEIIGNVSLSEQEKSILQSLSRFSSLAQNFMTKAPSELVEFSKGSSLSPYMLNICRAYYRNLPLSDRDLFILNDFASVFKASPEHYSISRFCTNEEYIAATYSDMMKKHAAIYPDYKSPCNIEKLLLLGGEAVRFNTPREYSLSDTAVFGGKNTEAKRLNCTFSGYSHEIGATDPAVFRRIDDPFRNERPLHRCKLAIIYNNTPEGGDSLKHFFEDLVNTNGVTSIMASSPQELLPRLIKVLNGLEINAELLPSTNILSQMPLTYRAAIRAHEAFFSENVFGGTVVAVVAPRSILNGICARAKKQGLSVCNAITPKRIKRLTVASHGKPAVNINVELLSSLRDMVGYQANVPTHDVSSIRKVNIEKVFGDASSKATVYKATVELDGSLCPYHDALYAATGLIVNAARDGYSLKDSFLSFTFGAELDLNSQQKIGKAISAIMGIYRAETELCVGDEHSAVEFSDGASCINIYLNAYSGKERNVNGDDMPSVNTLLFDSVDENGIPNFKNLRDFAFGKCVPTPSEE